MASILQKLRGDIPAHSPRAGQSFVTCLSAPVPAAYTYLSYVTSMPWFVSDSVTLASVPALGREGHSLEIQSQFLPPPLLHLLFTSPLVHHTTCVERGRKREQVIAHLNSLSWHSMSSRERRKRPHTFMYLVFHLISHHSFVRSPRVSNFHSGNDFCFHAKRRSFLPSFLPSFSRFPDSLDSSCGFSVPLFLEAVAAAQDTAAADRIKKACRGRRAPCRPRPPVHRTTA